MNLPVFNNAEEVWHYASENYDPQKAHEYYLKNRDLKGRHSTKGFSETQRQGLTYAKAQINTTKKNNLQAARDTEKQSIAQARAQAQAIRSEIVTKLKAFVDSLNKQHSENSQAIAKDAEAKRKVIDDKLAADIAALPTIPKNISKSQREKLLVERSDKIKTLRGKATADRDALNLAISNTKASEQTSIKEARKSNSTNAASVRAQVADQLKQVVAKYVEQYKATKTKVTSESEATLDKEFNNIKTKVR